MRTIRQHWCAITAMLLAVLVVPLASNAAGFTTVNDADWDEAAVRRVMRVFAYGGAATDQQITDWADLPPGEGIAEILSFEPVNELLSPVEDNTGNYGGSLAELQALWSTAGPDNPACLDDISSYRETRTRADGNVVLRNQGLQNTWIAAVRSHGLNPFRHRVGFWLVNYQMAVNLHDTEPPLIRDLYDSALAALEQERPFHEVLAVGATSAAVSREYGHRSNTFNNNTGVFKGNDDFAREFHQLFFLINGDTEDPDYHENTTIEKTARALTGMRIDKVPGAYGTTLASEWWVAPLDFSDHLDASGRNLRNSTRHHQAPLEILHQVIVGNTARDKLFALAAVAGQHDESLDNLPVSVVNFFADDNLDADKIAVIREAWREVAGQPNDFLRFLHAYATSTTFHSADTYKYFTAFDRNMTIYNLNTVDNAERYGNSFSPRSVMLQQGAEVFVPVHDVFGGQTSLNAANNPNLFKDAYNSAVDFPNRINKFSEACRNDNGDTIGTWRKDWGKLVPAAADGSRNAAAVGEWLWRRFVGDGGSNYGSLERAQITSLLATGYDLGYLADPSNPSASLAAEDLSSEPLASIVAANGMVNLDLDSTVLATRRDANKRIGLAVDFISMMPFMFATGEIAGAARPRSNILWRNRTSGENALYRMDGASIMDSMAITTVATDWNLVGTGDYNGDNNKDILWRNSVTGQVWMYLMNDATIIASAGVNTVVDTAWQIVGNGDYNGDGKDDILWRNGVTGQNWMYLMNAATITSSVGVSSVSVAWDAIGSGDYDGDGRSDILWRNSITGQNWMHLMNGATIASSIGVTPVPIGWNVVGNGDYNGDGRSDILWRHSTTGQNWMHLMNGATITSSAGVSTVSDTAWNVVGSGDYNGDGMADILWRNAVTGQTWMYLMSTNTVAASAGVNSVTDMDWRVAYLQ